MLSKNMFVHSKVLFTSVIVWQGRLLFRLEYSEILKNSGWSSSRLRTLITEESCIFLGQLWGVFLGCFVKTVGIFIKKCEDFSVPKLQNYSWIYLQKYWSEEFFENNLLLILGNHIVLFIFFHNFFVLFFHIFLWSSWFIFQVLQKL